eukprot:1136489-Pelagomonas_calceolata.AAC.5
MHLPNLCLPLPCRGCCLSTEPSTNTSPSQLLSLLVEREVLANDMGRSIFSVSRCYVMRSPHSTLGGKEVHTKPSKAGLGCASDCGIPGLKN